MKTKYSTADDLGIEAKEWGFVVMFFMVMPEREI